MASLLRLAARPRLVGKQLLEPSMQGRIEWQNRVLKTVLAALRDSGLLKRIERLCFGSGLRSGP